MERLMKNPVTIIGDCFMPCLGDFLCDNSVFYTTNIPSTLFTIMRICGYGVRYSPAIALAWALENNLAQMPLPKKIKINSLRTHIYHKSNQVTNTVVEGSRSAVSLGLQAQLVPQPDCQVLSSRWHSLCLRYLECYDLWPRHWLMQT